MKKLLKPWILIIALAVAFIPTISLGVEAAGNAGGDPAGSISADQIDQGQNQEAEWLVCDGDFDASKRTIIQKRGSSSSNEAQVAAHTAIRELMQKYADIDQYRNFSDQFGMTEEQINEMTSVAEEATAECTTDYEKIQKIFQFVASSIYYDYDGLPTREVELGYDAWVSKKTICEGYSQLCGIFLDCLDIPCMQLIGDDHAYNAAYDSQENRWIFFDSTWGSQNTYRNGEYHENLFLNNNYYDMSIEYISLLRNHEILLAGSGYTTSSIRALYLCPGNGANVKYVLRTTNNPTEWTDMSLWGLVAWLPDKNAETAIFGEIGQYNFDIDIGGNGFSKCPNLTSITLPEGTKHIGYEAFRDSTNLETINLPDTVTGIADRAFDTCSSLTSITIPDGVTELGPYTFSYCSNLENISLPRGMTSIGYSAFGHCSKLKGDVLPDSITTIADNAFSYCTSLTSVTIPEGITSMGNYVFSDCRELSDVTISEGVTYLGLYTFHGCYALTSITIPRSITSIEGSTFYGCSKLESITIPDSVANIGDYAFSYCRALKSIDLPDNLVDIGDGAFSNCSGLTSITIPEGISAIAANTFSGCSNLESVILSDSLTTIGEKAFYKCTSLTSVLIPDCVEQIGNSAFNSCTNLEKVVIPDSVITFGKNIFSRFTSLTIYCSKDSCALSFAVDNKIPYKLITPLQNCDISLFQATYHTTGEPIKPVITVKDGDVILTEGEQYRIIESDAVVGETSATVEGLDNYTGAVVVNYTITDHQWSEDYTIDYNATCQEEGSKSKHCTICNAINEETVVTTPIVDHKYGEWETTKTATCTEDGSKEKSCEFCGYKVIETIPLLNHQWEAPIYKWSEDNGSVTAIRVCSNDNSHKQTETVVASSEITKEPSCTTTGEQQFTSESFKNKAFAAQTKTEVMPKTEHPWDEGAVTKESTCSSEGVKTFHCTACDATKTETITALGHTWKHYKNAAGLLKNGTEYDYCTACKTKKNVKTLKGYATYYVKSFKVARAKNAFTAKWTKQSVAKQKKFSGYQIRYSLKSSMNSAKYATAKKTSTSKKISKLKAKRTYYVQVRTYTKKNGTTFYSKWSAKKSVKTK